MMATFPKIVESPWSPVWGVRQPYMLLFPSTMWNREKNWFMVGECLCPSISYWTNYSCGELNMKQESIPIGCVPPAFVVLGGMDLEGIARGYGPRVMVLGVYSPKGCTVVEGYSPGALWEGTSPPPPPAPMDRMAHACEKLLSRNFVCGR